MHTWKSYCVICDAITLHVEVIVPDKESATVWGCLVCGNEQRPHEPGTPNTGVKNIPPSPFRPIDNKERIGV
jgi:hypothetical protein